MIVSSLAELVELVDRAAEVRGRYGVQDLHGYTMKVKRPDGSWASLKRTAFLELVDGDLELWDRPEGEMLALDGKQVIVVGRVLRPSEPPPTDGAHPITALRMIDITSVEARGGD